MPRAVVSLGSNRGDRLAHLTEAVERAGELGETAGLSSLYQTAPWGGVEQDDFYNAALVLDADCDPFFLLGALHGIEARSGRVRGRKWGPRTLDLDLILYGDRIVRRKWITVPHPHYRARRFVVEPLAEAWPQARHPDGTLIADLLPALSDQDVRRLQAPAWPGPRIIPPEPPLNL